MRQHVDFVTADSRGQQYATRLKALMTSAWIGALYQYKFTGLSATSTSAGDAFERELTRLGHNITGVQECSGQMYGGMIWRELSPMSKLLQDNNIKQDARSLCMDACHNNADLRGSSMC